MANARCPAVYYHRNSRRHCYSHELYRRCHHECRPFPRHQRVQDDCCCNYCRQPSRATLLTYPNYYQPSVCRQTSTVHTHYNIILFKQQPFRVLSNLDALQNLARRVGGQTAGEVVTALLYRLSVGWSLHCLGVEYLNTEQLPLSSHCHTGEVGSPASGWDRPLFVPFQHITVPPPAHAKTTTIRHHPI